MADQLRLELFGGLRIVQGDTPVSGFVSAKAQALLCYLSVTGRPQFRATLAALLWSDLPDTAARMNLRHVLANLRQLVGEHLTITRESVALQSSVLVDVERFESALQGNAPGELSRLREAVGYYVGDFLDGFFVRDAPLWDEWAVSQRERLRQLALYTLHELVRTSIERGENSAALDYATRLLQLDPWREEAHRQVMLLLAESGQTAAALAQYQSCRHTLENQLGVEPDAETTVLYERIKAGEIVPRLPAKPKHNLPLPPTVLLGRRDELDALARLLKQPEVRLVSLLGPGGVGKTRLALETAALHFGSFGDGALLVELATVRQPVMLAAAIAKVLGLRESGRQPLLERIIAHLRDKHLLLLLDNFEQLLRAAPLVGQLLAACDGLKLLITSRAALGLRGEHVFAVAPLAVPDLALALSGEDISPTELAGYAAVDLFVRHASSVWHGFALAHDNAAAVAEICCRLDGLPLAIELAAARIRLLSPQALRARLSNRLALLTGGAADLPARQQTLRATIDWSYDLLAPDEQSLLRRAAVFVGSYGVEDAQAVCSLDSLSANRILDGLFALVGRSLLRVVESADGEQRFDMLETIREYAAEQLAVSGEGEAVRQRHAAHYLALAELAEPHLQGAEQRHWLDRLELEHDNLRAALHWLLGSGETAMALRLSAALGEFWWPRGHVSEGRRWLESALARSGGQAAARAKALYRAGELAFAYGDYSQSVELLGESLALHRSLGDLGGSGRVLRGLANTLVVLGEEDRATQLRNEALSIFEQIDDRWGIAWMLYHLALLERDTERQIELFERSLEVARGGGYMRTTFAALNDLANIALERRNYPRAEQLYSECLDLCQALGDLWLRAWPLAGLGLVAGNNGNYRRAKALFESSLLAHQQAQNRSGIAQLLSYLGDIARWQNDLQGAQLGYDRCMSLFEEMNDTRGLARSHVIRAQLASAGGENDKAVSLFWDGLSLLPLLGAKIRPADYLFALGGIAAALDTLGYGEASARLFGSLQGLGFADEPHAALVMVPDSIALLRRFEDAQATLAQRYPLAWSDGQSMSLAAAIAQARAFVAT